MATVRFTSPIFDKAKRTQSVSNFVSKQAREFKRLTQERMTKGPHTGTLYAKKRGSNFRRSHRASARHQRPSPDTLTLVNAISQRTINPLRSQVYIAERVNPENGAIASNYGAILQTRLDRPIMSIADAAVAQRKMEKDAEVLIKTLS